MKEGHSPKACTIMVDGDWENQKKDQKCCAKQGQGMCSTGYYMDWSENPQACMT